MSIDAAETLLYELNGKLAMGLSFTLDLQELDWQDGVRPEGNEAAR
nr:hypothetical protein [Paraburkholderia sp. BL8N3]